MKIYGNSRSDGFSMFVTVVAAGAVGAGFLLNTVGGLSLLAAIPVFVAVVAIMIMRASKWDVLSDAPAAAGIDTGLPVRLPNFPVKAETDAAPATPSMASAWSAATALPSVDKPKVAVETNTAVA